MSNNACSPHCTAPISELAVSEAEDAAKLEVLREAAGVGTAALDRGEFKELENIEDLQTYLNGVSEKIISSTAE
jgi:antitoxin ParD1/3/4